MDIGFFRRLNELQSLCSSVESNIYALLVICGSDGKNNRGARNLLKYLFCGAVGKELYDDSGEGEVEDMEDVVLLIQQSSLSIMWRLVTYLYSFISI